LLNPDIPEQALHKIINPIQLPGIYLLLELEYSIYISEITRPMYSQVIMQISSETT